MPDSAREAALVTLKAALDTISGPTVLRNEVAPGTIPDAGLVILSDGEVGEPESVTLSPTIYHYEHTAEVEVYYRASSPVTRDTGLDGLLQQIGAVIAADRTLGGAVDYVRNGSPDLGHEYIEGAADVKVARVPVILSYTTTDPLS